MGGGPLRLGGRLVGLAGVVAAPRRAELARLEPPESARRRAVAFHLHRAGRVVLADTATVARIRAAKARGGRVVAIGTTSLRLLETAAAETGEVMPFAGETRLFILPGYRFKAIDLLLTNFHLPRSTLFMLVAALAGLDRVKSAYVHAIAARYRFFSYGDACLIEPHP